MKGNCAARWLALVLSFPAMAEERGKQWAVWFSPLPFMVYVPTLLDADPLNGTVAVPLGASLAVSPRWNVVAEVAYLRGWGGWWGPDQEDGTRNFSQIAFAVGAEVSLSGTEAIKGWFLMPKLIGAHWWDERIPSGYGTARDKVALAGASTEVQLGVDFGYQVHWQSLYFASFIGLSAGYSTGGGGTAGPLFANSSASPGFVYAPNLNLFRLGATF